MHILLALLLLAALVYLVVSTKATQATPARDESALPEYSGATPELAFIANGKLNRRLVQGELAEVHSPFFQNLQDREQRSQELHAWKEGTAFATNFSSGRARSAEERELRVSSATFASAEKLLYVLADSTGGGLFEQNIETGVEKRLLHRPKLLLDHLRLSPDGTKLFAAQRSSNGIANIVSMGLDGSELRELTGGDTSDLSPCGVPDQPNAIVFQSSGIARGPSGASMAFGPASIQWLDTQKASVSTVIEDPAFDFLQPRTTANGDLLYLRRPYEGQNYRSTDALADTLLFPFRLLRAVFHYLNFFSLMYTRKPLTNANGAPFNADARAILLQGKRVDAEAALRKGTQVLGVRSLVPASWQLFRKDRQGNVSLLARHVAAFDVQADGSIFYTNGYGIFVIRAGYKSQVLLRDKMIGELAVRPH